MNRHTMELYTFKCVSKKCFSCEYVLNNDEQYNCITYVLCTHLLTMCFMPVVLKTIFELSNMLYIML